MQLEQFTMVSGHYGYSTALIAVDITFMFLIILKRHFYFCLGYLMT